MTVILGGFHGNHVVFTQSDVEDLVLMFHTPAWIHLAELQAAGAARSARLYLVLSMLIQTFNFHLTSRCFPNSPLPLSPHPLCWWGGRRQKWFSIFERHPSALEGRWNFHDQAISAHVSFINCVGTLELNVKFKARSLVWILLKGKGVFLTALR